MSVTIYGIQCKVNKKIYIGQTTNYKNRIRNHKLELRHKRHTNPFLQSDFDTYGENNFIFIILEENVVDSEALKIETKYMNKYGGTNSSNIYNVKGNFLGDDNKEYAKRKMAHFKGNYAQHTGHSHSDKSKNKISKSLKVSYKNGTHKLCGAVSEGQFGELNSFYGKHHSQQIKDKLSKIKTKYDGRFIQELRNLKQSGMKVKEIAELYNMNKNVVGCLINYGTSSMNKIKIIKLSQNYKCND